MWMLCLLWPFLSMWQGPMQSKILHRFALSSADIENCFPTFNDGKQGSNRENDKPTLRNALCPYPTIDLECLRRRLQVATPRQAYPSQAFRHCKSWSSSYSPVRLPLSLYLPRCTDDILTIFDVPMTPTPTSDRAWTCSFCRPQSTRALCQKWRGCLRCFSFVIDEY